jgi:hypothetical protein
MIVRNLNRIRAAVSPNETDSVLIVNANAVLPFAVALELLQVVAWWNQKISQCHGDMNHQELSESHSPQVGRRNALVPASFPEFLCFGIGKASDHLTTLTGVVNNVHRS